MVRGEGTTVAMGVTPDQAFDFVLDPAQYTKADTKMIWVTKLANTPDGMLAREDGKFLGRFRGSVITRYRWERPSSIDVSTPGSRLTPSTGARASTTSRSSISATVRLDGCTIWWPARGSPVRSTPKWPRSADFSRPASAAAAWREGTRTGRRFESRIAVHPSAEVTRTGHTHVRSRYVDPYDATKRFKATVQIGWSLLGRVQVSSQLEAFG
jgi:hypothetical protein